MTAFRFLPVLLLAAAVSACSADATISSQQPKTQAISNKSSITLQVTSTPDDDSQEVVKRLRSELYGHLLSDGVFGQVVDANAPADYTMTVAVDQVRKVSQTARILLGVIAGDNELTVHVDLKNATTHANVAQFDVKGESASHPMSSENDMDSAIDKVVEQIITALR
ncbi:MAG TPA: DUF4410 domain-containing protein [Dongiaceae bacterium]|jgi:hypothetical protein